MPDPYPWQFQQLSSAAGSQPKTMILQGWQAPFGRPRHGTLVNAGVNVHSQLTHYPGKGIAPTVHSFGSSPKAWELHGRWMDFAIGGPGLAQKARNDWRDFIEDEQIVRATWGAVLSYKIFIHEADFDYESSGEIAWSIKAHAIEDENAAATPVQVIQATPLSLASQMGSLLNATLKLPTLTAFNLRGLLGSITDALDSIIATINSPFTFIYNTCSALSDFETALSSDVGRMLGGLSMMRTGCLELRDTTDYMTSTASAMNSVDSLVTTDLQSPSGFFPGDVMQRITVEKAASDAANANLLALIADMRSQLLIVQRGQPQSAYVPNTGDTWESIGQRLLGGADGADAIRAMNGVRYGQKPIPGKRITIPRSA